MHMLQNGEGLLYELVEDMVNPVKLVKTVSQEDLKKDDDSI